MSAAYLNFEDQDGKLAFNAVYKNGFNPESGAHQAALAAVKYLDTIMEKDLSSVQINKDVPTFPTMASIEASVTTENQSATEGAAEHGHEKDATG